MSGASLPQQGEIIAGKYRVERVLGAGGMGVVVAAQHVRLDEKVALKFLLPDARVSQEAVARFEREARAASKIKNEHVARVSDVGTLDNGSPYMVMEYLDGSDLSSWLGKSGRMPLAQAVDFVLQACEALAEAHSLGIVHRDLKPANLFCIQRTDGQLCIKVLDFGISKLTNPGGDSVSMTRTTALLGSPLYMSPEQMMQSKGVDARTDIWSLGTILFELVTGAPPFNADTVTELAIRIHTYPHPAVRSLAADVPLAFEQVVARCLEKDRAKRFPSVAELAVALAEFAPPHARLSVDRVVGTLQRAAGASHGASGALAATAAAPALAAPARRSGEFGAGAEVAATALATSSNAVASPTVVPAQTGASWGNTAAGTVPSSGAGLRIVAALGIVAVLGGVGFQLHRTPASGVAASALASAMPAPAATPAAAESATAPPPAASSAPPPTAASSVSPPVAAASTPPRRTVAPRSAPLHPSAHAATPKADCDPPFTINALGDHEYKPECL